MFVYLYNLKKLNFKILKRDINIDVWYKYSSKEPYLYTHPIEMSARSQCIYLFYEKKKQKPKKNYCPI